MELDWSHDFLVFDDADGSGNFNLESVLDTTSFFFPSYKF